MDRGPSRLALLQPASQPHEGPCTKVACLGRLQRTQGCSLWAGMALWTQTACRVSSSLICARAPQQRLGDGGRSHCSIVCAAGGQASTATFAIRPLPRISAIERSCSPTNNPMDSARLNCALLRDCSSRSPSATRNRARRAQVTQAERARCSCRYGSELQRIRRDVSEKLEYVPDLFAVVRHIRRNRPAPRWRNRLHGIPPTMCSRHCSWTSPSRVQDSGATC